MAIVRTKVCVAIAERHSKTFAVYLARNRS